MDERDHKAMNEELNQPSCLGAVSGSFPIEEVALHAANDWYDTAKFRSDIQADLKSYYEGYRDAMRFCKGNDR
jgi:predicted transcriptional regulator